MSRLTGVLACLLLLIAGGIGYWLGRSLNRPVNPSEEVARLEQDNQTLKTTVERLRAENAVLLGEAEEGGAPVGAPGKRAPRPAQGSLPADTELIRSLQESLAAANQSNSTAQTRIKELETELDEVREERTRLAAVETDLGSRIAAIRSVAEAKESDLARQAGQIAQLEAANKRLRDDAGSVGQKTTQQAQVLNELQELYRRRESYLTTMISRYREITEQYRAFVSVMENRRGPEGTAGGGMSIASPELGRIQNSIAMAEEDLRQLTSLNAQVATVQKKLATK